MQRPDLKIDGFTFVALAACLLILPLWWIAAALLAGAVHEFWHWAAVSLCGGRICRIRIGPSGAIMDAPPMAEWQKLICSLAGPLGGLTLLLTARWLPRTAICAAIHSAYNLLPACPLDGGRALKSLSSMLFSCGTASKICSSATAITCIFLLLLGAYCTFLWHGGAFCILITMAVVARIAGNSRKTPCKAAQFTIQ